MVDYNGFNPSTTISFVVKNNSSMNRSIKVFNTTIGPGNTLDLMKVPGVTEEDIRSALTKGPLKTLLAGGSLTIVSSSANFLTADVGQSAFLKSVGLSGSSLSPSGALTQSAWYIDSVNGSDSNSGSTSNAALKTMSELARRWGVGGQLRNPNSTITVNLLNNLALDGTDPLSYNVMLMEGTTLVFQGNTPAQTAMTVTAVRAKNRATNTPWGLTLSSSATPFVGKRILDVTTGAYAWGIKDEGSNVLRTTEWCTPPTGFGSGATIISNANRATPQSTDTFVMQTLISVEPGAQTVNGGRKVSGGNRPGVAWVDLNVPSTGGADLEFQSGSGVFWNFVGCSFNRGFVPGGGTFALQGQNCLFTFMRILATQTIPFLAGGMLNGNGSSAPQPGVAELEFDLDFIFQSSAMVVTPGTRVLLGTVGAFDSTGGTQNFDNSGIMAWTASGLQLAPRYDTTGALWGAGNPGYGLHIAGGATVAMNNGGTSIFPVANLTISGSLGDFALAGQATNAFSYVLNTGAPNAPVTCSWANLATADAAGSGLFYPAQGCGICRQS